MSNGISVRIGPSLLMWHPYTLDMVSNPPSVHDQIAQGLREHPAKKGLPFNILITALEIGGSIILFHFAQRMGASDVVSYLVGSIAPVLGGFAIWIRARKFSGASAAIFTSCPVVIAYGQEGPCVAALQRLLNADPPRAGIYHDGIFGPQTLAATRQFQSRHGLPANGRAGAGTIKVLGQLAPAPRPVPAGNRPNRPRSRRKSHLRCPARGPLRRAA